MRYEVFELQHLAPPEISSGVRIFEWWHDITALVPFVERWQGTLSIVWLSVGHMHGSGR